MTQPAGTFDSYDSIGIREDLSDIIYDVSPDDTPFYSKCAKTSASNTLHEWQTDSLRASAENKHIEGDDTVAADREPTVRLGNYTQIFKDAVVIPDTDNGLDKAGRAKEIGYQTLKIAKEQKLDIELALLGNQAKAVGSSTVARQLAGVPAWMVTSTNIQDGTLATGDGSDNFTPGATPTAFDQAKFDDVMQQIWTAGGKPDTCYLSAFQMNLALGFIGNNNQRSTIKAEDDKVIKHMDVYVTPWGTVEFVPSREINPAFVYIMQDDMWKVAVLRPTKNTPLAKTGDSTRRQVITELTLAACNEQSSGMIADLTVA
jgi:hypothetical protein